MSSVFQLKNLTRRYRSNSNTKMEGRQMERENKKVRLSGSGYGT